MAKKAEKAAATEKKGTAKAVTPAADPFDSLADILELPPLETVEAVSPTASAPAATEAMPAVKDAAPTAPKRKARVSKPKNVIVADPFSDTAASPDESTTSKPVPATLSTKQKKSTRKPSKKATLDATAKIATDGPKVELSAAFKALAEPKLQELPRDDRAQVMMQSPTELYFYWSIREDPYRILRDAFGDETGSYTLVLKLTEMRSGVEEIHRAEADGNWWFDVEPDGEYRAEIGFYAPNRPYFRIVYSNTVETPRRSPSPHSASDAEWRIPAHKFAEVLDVAGFAQDAVDVAMAGDDHVTAADTAHTAFSNFLGSENTARHSFAADDIRFTLVGVASGLTLEELRWRVSPAMFTVLQTNADKLAAGNAKTILAEHFDIDGSEFIEEHYGSAVHGGSLVNFPRTLKPRKLTSHYRPVSSHSLR